MGITPIALYRLGNANGPRMENVRVTGPVPDIDTFVDRAGVVWVHAMTGGVSAWETPVSGLRGRSWRIPAGTPYSDRLRVWNDDPESGHWSWEPVRDMMLSEFTDALRDVNQFAQPA